MNMTLYIDGKAADVDARSLILYNYTRDEATNPTIVKNSYSQKVTIPGTPTNNAIFSHYYRSDFAVGSAFNPIAKTPFELRNALGEIVESGYVKMESVQRKGKDVVSYTVTLIGGLGGLFYALSYNDDGTEKTLADLKYKAGDEYKVASNLMTPITSANVRANWNEFATSGSGRGDLDFYSKRLWTNVPCNNGYPTGDFDANKALYPSTGLAHFDNIPNYVEGYTTKAGANGYILLQLANKHTEWEMRDLRAYLQRPAISVKGLLDTICLSQNTGAYTLRLDTSVFNSTLMWYYVGWLTLPAISREKATAAFYSFADMLEGTSSPAAYLIGFAKMFGLVFLYDPNTKTITLTDRAHYYNDNTPKDITDRIDTDTLSFKPLNIDKRWYIFQNTMLKGEFTAQYAEDYGKEYGSQWVDTSYQFNDEQGDLLSGLPFKGAADVQEYSAAYAFEQHNFTLDMLEEIKYELYDNNGGTSTQRRRREYDASALTTFVADSYANYLALPQFHAANNAAQEGANVLLYFNGMKQSRQVGDSMYHIPFHVTDDVEEFAVLNNGKPCWIADPVYNSSDQPNIVTSLPSFRRWRFANGTMTESMDFGNVARYQTGDTFVPNVGVYHRCWKKYIEDRFNAGTRVLTCKVDLSGMKVNADLLRKFYAFDGAIWSLNKIKNYCPSKHALTECEFIKVQSITNYNG